MRGLGLGKLLIDTLLRLGDVVGCYKVLLDCSDDNVPFYERCGMQVKVHGPLPPLLVLLLNLQRPRSARWCAITKGASCDGPE